MDHLQLHLALIETIQTWYYLLNINQPVQTVYNLLPERVLLMLIDHEVGG